MAGMIWWDQSQLAMGQSQMQAQDKQQEHLRLFFMWGIQVRSFIPVSFLLEVLNKLRGIEQSIRERQLGLQPHCRWDGMAWKAVDEAQEKSSPLGQWPWKALGEPGCSQRLRFGKAGWVFSLINGLVLYSLKRWCTCLQREEKSCPSSSQALAILYCICWTLVQPNPVIVSLHI